MDSLLQHCLRELAFDGEYGECDFYCKRKLVSHALQLSPGSRQAAAVSISATHAKGTD